MSLVFVLVPLAGAWAMDHGHSSVHHEAPVPGAADDSSADRWGLWLGLCLPLVLVLAHRARRFLPLALVLLVVQPHHSMAMPSTVDHEPPPLCCLLAQSPDAPSAPAVPVWTLVHRLPLPCVAVAAEGATFGLPLIRGPPVATV